MMYKILLLLLTLASSLVQAAELRYSLHKLEGDKQGKTLLVVGGIQGDEPGGFTAASLLVTQYKIKQGNVWVVPNLNFESIIKRSRGVYGDMNRKFSKLNEKDPEYKTVQEIKKLILNDEVDVILNLHDGSGFYREEYVDKLRNKHRWGQSVIIDQESIGHHGFYKLKSIAENLVNAVNIKINDKEHAYRVKNTNTYMGDKEMEKTLTYFAIKNNKPAFGVEASKQLLTHQRAKYHLKVIEAMMGEMGIGFDKGFELTENGVYRAINQDLKLSMFGDRVLFDVADARRQINYVPLRKDAEIEYKVTNPLMAVIENSKNIYRVRYGNRHVTVLKPQYMDFESSVDGLLIDSDGKTKRVGFGEKIYVNQFFKVFPSKGYRINIIGFTTKVKGDESGISVYKKDIMRRFSVDKKGNIYRVEMYKGNRFCGMILVDFSEAHSVKNHNNGWLG